ncbi:unnamed protein product [Moneuplotes crassus]|uniref:Uncharacterized protein n=1 Tax=Euplotes crassus TaxID=5936 RepID=A0AAD1U0D8_EUPCR|nr:unnamed protein product [Moneuplotes crassus]
MKESKKIKSMLATTKQNVLLLCQKMYEEIEQGKIPTNFILPNLSDEELEKWQDIYALAMKDIAKEKGKREAFKEYHTLQKKLQEIYAINDALHDRIKKVQENEFKTVSVSDIQNEVMDSFDLNSFDELIEDEPKCTKEEEKKKLIIEEKSDHAKIGTMTEDIDNIATFISPQLSSLQNTQNILPKYVKASENIELFSNMTSFSKSIVNQSSYLVLKTDPHKECKPSKLRYNSDSSLKEEKEDSVISISESSQEIIAGFEESPNKICKSAKRAKRKQDSSQVSLQKMMQANTDERIEDYHPIICKDDHFGSNTLSSVEKCTDKYLENLNGNADKNLKFSGKTSLKPSILDEGIGVKKFGNKTLEKKKSVVSNYFVKDFEIDNTSQDSQEVYSIHYDTRKTNKVSAHEEYLTNEDMEVYSLNIGSTTHRDNKGSKKFVFEESESEEDLNKIKNRPLQIPNSNKSEQEMSYLGTPEILSKHITKIKSPKNMPYAQINYQQMVKPNFVSSSKLANSKTQRNNEAQNARNLGINHKKDKNHLLKGKENEKSKAYEPIQTKKPETT